MRTYPSDEYAKTVCKIGMGHECCRYLTIGPAGWSCEKLSILAPHLDRRVAAKEMTARGDNCPGLDSR